jgi:hypothetical protein
MSIVHSGSEQPRDGATVFAENENGWSDRCVFYDGKFHAGGEFPAPPYELTHVVRWFDLSEYGEVFRSRGINCYHVSFDEADGMEPVP